MPLVSIITPLHNKGPYIAETIESVIAQTHADWEMIIVENGSTDDGAMIASRFDDPRVHLVIAPPSVRGPGSARNLGLEGASGEWVLFLDADDLILPDYLSNMLTSAANRPEANIIASPWHEFVDGESMNKSVVKYPAAIREEGVGIADYAIAFTCWAVHAAIVQKKILGHDPWPVDLDGHLAEDTAFWFRLVGHANVAYSQTAGAMYRTQTSECRTDFTAKAWFEGNHKAATYNLKHIAGLGRHPTTGQMETLVRFYEGMYQRALRDGDNYVSRQAVDEAHSWLDRLRETSSFNSASFRMRRHLGIPRFVMMKNLLSKFKNSK